MGLNIIKHYLNNKNYIGVDLYLNDNTDNKYISVNKIDEDLSNTNVLVVTDPEDMAINLNCVSWVRPFEEQADISDINF